MKSDVHVRIGEAVGLIASSMLCVAMLATVATAKPHVAFEPREDSLLIRVDERPLATYVYRDGQVLRPYFKDVCAPGGIQVTRHHPPREGGDPIDHATMHPGLWLAFGDLGGADFWRNKASVVHGGFVKPPCVEGDRGTFTVRNDYVAGGVTVCEEVCTYTFHVRPDGCLILWDSTFHSEQTSLFFGDQEEMGLGIRVATSLMVRPHENRHRPGRILDSGGRRDEKETWGEQAAWCDYAGWVDDAFVGIMVIPDPRNAGPCRWHTRDYGLMVANPFGRSVFRKGPAGRTEVAPGAPFHLRFGVLIHAGGHEDDFDPAAAYQDFLKIAVPTKALPSAPPNILVILADDLGYGDVQSYNRERGKIPTPNIDRLAAEGMRFTDAHSSSGVCSPSRYTLLTGRYHWRSRLQQGIVPVWGAPLIAPDRLTVAGLARQCGYRTACTGKWHLGRDWPIAEEERKHFAGLGGKPGGGGEVATIVTDAQRAAWKTVFSRPISGGPTTRGFDEYFGTDVPNWPPYCFIENDHTVGIPSELLSAGKLVQNQASLQGPALPGWQLEAILPTLADRAIDFIRRQVAARQPFLLYLPLTSPHTPLAVNKQWLARSGLNLYADFVMETDAAVGRVLDALREGGAAENTLVLFTSDNGCAPYIGARELESKGHFPSGPLRGYKGAVFEGGHRVPFIVRWPGVVEPGRVCGQLTHHADLLATVADILDVKLPDGAGEDSFSLLPLLKGGERPIRAHAVSCASNGVPGLRRGPWKLVLERDLKAKTNVQLYHLDSDIGEATNLAAKEPQVVEEMLALMDRLIADGRSTPGAKRENDVEVRRYPVEAATR